MDIRNKSIRVMLADDNLTMLWGLGKLIQDEFPKMMLAGTANNVAEALMFARLRPHIILLGLSLEGHSSLDLISEIKHRSGGQILIYTNSADELQQEDALQLGVMGIIKKGDSADIILQAIDCAYHGELWQLPA